MKDFSEEKMYPVIEVPASGNSQWYGGAYTLTFVYSKHHGNFILKGYMNEVESYLKKNYTHYFTYMSMWSSHGPRGYWRFWKDSIFISEPSRSRHPSLRSLKYKVGHYTKYNDNGDIVEPKKILEFKRLPKRWIPEFDKL